MLPRGKYRRNPCDALLDILLKLYAQISLGAASLVVLCKPPLTVGTLSLLRNC